MNNTESILPEDLSFAARSLAATPEVDFIGPLQLSFNEARKLQERFISEKIELGKRDTVFLCEHPKTISCGKRSTEKELLVSKKEFEELGIEVVKCERGGEVTAHLPGQLVIYPVISLRHRGLGVRRFVELGLESICDLLSDYGLQTSPDLEYPGVWIKDGGGRKKIAAVGLSIHHGVTNHGFSINVNCDLSIYSYIAPCGLASTSVTSLKALGLAVEVDEIAARFKKYFMENRT